MTTQTISRDERLELIEHSLFHNPEGLRVVELAKTCDVDRRTIYRDLAHLRANGVPLYRKDGRFYISRDYYLASVRFKIHEIIALFAAVRVMAQVAPKQSPHMISALSRLGGVLPMSIAPHFEQTSKHLREAPVDRLFVSVLETLTRAWGQQHRVHIWYGHHLIDFAPYCLEVSADGTWIIVGEVDSTGQIQALSLGRITRAELLTTTYQAPANFDTATYLSNGLEAHPITDTPQLKITLAAQPETVQQIIRDKKSVTLSENPQTNGHEIISFTVVNWQDQLPWLRAFGSAIEVLEPEPLRAKLREEALALCAIYK